MTGQDQGVAERLELLAGRVERIERLLGIAVKSLARSSDPGPRHEPEATAEAAPVPVAVLVEAAPATSPATATMVREPSVVSTATTTSAPRATTAAGGFSFERSIGQRWFAAAGALIVVVGVVLFFKLAYDLGWIGNLSPAARCAAGGLFGAALLVAGEWLRRHAGAIAAAGVSAAGLGAMYASAYASEAMYGLVGSAGAMAMLCAVVALGLYVGARAQLASVATVALVGGYLAPLLMASRDASPLFMPTYLIALLIVAQSLVAWRVLSTPTFVALRIVAWAGTVLLGMLWIFTDSVPGVDSELMFMIVVWTLMQGELVLTAMRDGARTAAARTSLAVRAGAMIAMSISATAWFTVIVVSATIEVLKWPAWWVCAFVAALTLAIGWLLMPRALHERPTSARGALGVGFVVQGASLVVVTLEVAFSGWTLIAAWLIVGVAGVIAARVVRSAGLGAYGIVNLCLGTGLFLLDAGLEGPGAPITQVAGLVMTDATWRSLIVAAAWLVSASVLHDRARKGAGIEAVCAIIGVAFLAFGPTANVQSSAHSIGLYWALVGLVAACAGRLAPRLGLAAVGLVLSVLGAGAWAVAHGRGWDESAAAALAHPGLWSALLIAGVMLVIASRLIAGQTPEPLAKPIAVMGTIWSGVFALAATSLEVQRVAVMWVEQETAARAALSIYWALLAVMMVWRGFAARSAGLRYAGLALMSVAAAKVVLVDLAGVGQAWRVVSFVGVGLLMLGVAAGYGRVAARAGRSPDAEGATGAPGAL
jgi:uncharacterized membrane protein